MIVSFLSPDGRYDDLYLSNFATIYVRDELLRVPGVSDITYMGERDYSIRAWLDPQKMAACGLTAVDVANAIQSQNLAAALGQLGQAPVPKGRRSSADRRDGPTRRPRAVRRDRGQGRHEPPGLAELADVLGQQYRPCLRRRPRAPRPAGSGYVRDDERRVDDRDHPEPRLGTGIFAQGDGITASGGRWVVRRVSNSLVSGLTRTRCRHWRSATSAARRQVRSAATR